MAEPLTTAAIGTVLVKALKEVGKWAWGYIKKTISNLWENKWIILVAGASHGLFIMYYNMLNNWFAFPTLLNIGVLGIFALINLSWVVGYWKSSPSDSKSNNQGPQVNIS
ncbi:MAG: hypothetical protein MRERV_27c011 [Mycoplasmataceae bacterium RV_VA103A]|nr:MAG: hypothetical protein MRERV_27c011 [Mycoplasmataceae bacterium RV_VA103A]